MTADEAKQKVLEVYPDLCITHYRIHNAWVVWESKDPFAHVLGRGETKELAILDAASKLLTPIPTPASEPFEDNFTEAAAFAGITFSQGCQFWMKMNHLTGNGPAPEFLPTPPSTEESGEPDLTRSDRGHFYQDWRIASLAAKAGHRALVVTTAGDFEVFTSQRSMEIQGYLPNPTYESESADGKDASIRRLTNALREALTQIAVGAATPELIEHGIQLTISGHYERKEATPASDTPDYLRGKLDDESAEEAWHRGCAAGIELSAQHLTGRIFVNPVKAVRSLKDILPLPYIKRTSDRSDQ